MSNFWRKMKNGFTAVELAIVIAVIAVLIAIIVPTFISILNSARKSNDSSLVYNANQTLQIEETLSGESYDNVTDAITTLLNNDYSLEDLTATADGCTLAYDTSTNSFVLLEDYTAEDVDADDICVINPDSTTLTEATASGITNFCVYDTSETVTVETDLPVTFYIYTKENSTTTIDAASATVNYYGKSGIINITAVDSKSFHTYGTADTINLTQGHIEFCDGSETGTFNILGEDTRYTFTAGAKIGNTIYKDADGNTYIPLKINYIDGNTDIPLYTRPTESYVEAEEIAIIAAALYPYGVSYRANEDEATITFDTDGGTFETLKENQLTTDDFVITASTAVTYENHRFDGWYYGSDILFSETAELSGTTIKSDLTLYAKWTEIYNVSYSYVYFRDSEITETKALTDSGYQTTVIAGNTISEPATPEVTGYTFASWYTDESCTAEYDFSTAVTTDITLYAKLDLNNYTVNFYNEYTYSGNDTAIKSIKLYHGETISANDVYCYFTENNYTPYYPASTEVTEGSKTFDGWYTDIDCTSGNEFTFGTEITGDMNVYAKWVDVNVTVTLELNGGFFESSPTDFTENDGTYTTTITYGSTVDIAAPEKSGNEFLGWYTDKNCTQKFTIISTTVTENITLYAGWECTEVTINGVTYTRKTLDSSANGTVTFGSTITVDNITKYWVVTGYTEDISVYYGDTWLVLENEIYGYPVLEIAAGALANVNSSASAENSLTNVLVPENIVMVGSRAFLDNKCIKSIVFLADTVYFSNSTTESYTTGADDDGYFNNVETGKEYSWTSVSYKTVASKNYPFYGCGTNSNNTATNLTVYYKTAYSTDCTVSENGDTKTITLDGGVFVINRSGNSISGYTYYRTLNCDSSDKDDTPTYIEVNWLYINTTTISQTLTCGEYDRGDFDWASALTDVLTGYGVSCCSNDGYVFMACGLTDDLITYIETQLKVAINSFTAEYGEYINGYTISIDDSGDFDLGGLVTCGNSATDVKISVTANSTPYYLVNLSQYLTVASDGTTTAWTGYEYSVDTTDGAAITYSYTVDGKAITVTAQFTGNVEYFTYDEKYSTYYGEACGEDLYAADNITITGSSKYNYELTYINGTATTEKDDGTFTYKITISEVTDIALGWTQTDAKYINIVSGIDFTINDDSNTTTISKSADGTTGDTLFYTEVANKIGGTLNDCEITTEEKGYYFLGWAYMNGESFVFTTVSIINPDEDDSSVFNNSATYYAIWGYWGFAAENEGYDLTGYNVATSGIDLPAPTDDSFTFFNWYTDSKLTGGTALTSGTIIYYAKAAASSVTVNGVVYTFIDTSTTTSNGSYANYTSTTATFGNNPTISVAIDGGFYRITGYDSTTITDKGYTTSGSWLVLENTINSYKVLEIGAGSFKDALLKNVIVPENIVMIYAMAFLDNYGMENIAFLADKVIFGNNTSITSYNSVSEKFDDNHTGKNYAFYGCTSTSGGNSASLNIYYNTATNDWTSSGSWTLHDDTFTVRYNSSNYIHDSNVYAAGTWLYIDTAINTTTIAGSTFELDNALIAALKAYATTNSVTYYQNGDHMFIAASYSDLYSYVVDCITDAIDDFSAQYGSYINGHTVSVESDSDNSLNITVGISDSTAYYLVEVGTYIGENAVISDTPVNNEDGSVTYTYTESSTYTFTVTISDARYYEDATTSAGDNTGLYVKSDEVTITASSDKNTHSLSSVAYGETTYTYGDGTSGGITLDGSTMEYSASVTFGAAVGTLSLGWTAVENTSTITIYSAVAAKVGDTELSKTDGETLYSNELEMDTAYSISTNTSGTYYVPDLTTTENNYYFLGYAAYMDNGSITNSTSGTLTFTEIAVNNTTFNNSNTYYSIWGTGVTATLTSAITGTSGTSIPTSYTYYDETSESYETIYVTLSNSDGSFYAWYGDESFTTAENALLNDTYIYYARMSFTLNVIVSAQNTTVTYNELGGSATDNTVSTTSSNTTQNLSLASIKLIEGNTLKIYVDSDYHYVYFDLGNGAIWFMYGKKGDNWRELCKQSKTHKLIITNDSTEYYANTSNTATYNNNTCYFVYSTTVNSNIKATFNV